VTGGAPVAATAYGVDVGGTKILGVALSGDGAVQAELRVPTPEPLRAAAAAADPHGALAGAVADVVRRLGGRVRDDVGPPDAARPPGPEPVGVGLPGMVTGGTLQFSPHLSGAVDRIGASAAAFSLRLSAELAGAPVVVHNDANLAALGELTLGAARGVRQGIVVTLGTGIGGAIVVDGEVRAGAHGMAGEVGHMVVDPSGPPCPCGGKGCWERYASGGGLARLAREAALAGTIPEAVALAGGHAELVRGEHVTQAAAAGDAGSRRVVEQLGWWLALGLANLAAAFDPERMVVAGGLVAAGEMLLAPTREAFASLLLGRTTRPEIPIVAAELGERAGAIGAALAASGFLGAVAPHA